MAICLVLILVDSFSCYPQGDKLPVFYFKRFIVHLSLSVEADLVF